MYVQDKYGYATLLADIGSMRCVRTAHMHARMTSIMRLGCILSRLGALGTACMDPSMVHTQHALTLGNMVVPRRMMVLHPVYFEITTAFIVSIKRTLLSTSVALGAADRHREHNFHAQYSHTFSPWGTHNEHTPCAYVWLLAAPQQH